MNRVLTITGGLVLGAAVAAGVVLLFAPQSGAETRQMIQDRIEAILEEGRQAAEDRRSELRERHSLLIHVLPLSIRVGNLRFLVTLKEEELCDPLPGVDLCR